MNIMKNALFIDRDGTLIKEPEDEQIDAYLGGRGRDVR